MTDAGSGTYYWGVALIIASTVAIALVPSLAKIAYEGGSNTMTVITVRSVFSVSVMAFLHLVLHQSLAIARAPLLIALGVGAIYGMMLYCYLGAVNYLPVNLVILIFFIHPMLVGLIAAALGLERLTWVMLAALAVALVGLGLAMGLSFQGLDLLGVLLASGAMVGAALTIVGNARAMKAASPLRVLFYMMLAAAIVLIIPLAVSREFAVPVTGLGWVGLLGVSVAATFGTIAFFYGMATVGPTRASMISNLEPVLGVATAMIILGERLTWVQGLGVAMVVGAIVWMEQAREG